MFSRILVTAGGSGLAVAALSFWAGCGTGAPISPVALEPDGQASEPADPQSGRDDGGIASDASADGDARAPSVDGAAPGASCAANESCQDGQACYHDDGSVYRECHCSAGKLACIETSASPPTTCFAGGACATDGSSCAVDDGTKPAYCTCTAGQWTCLPVQGPSSSCSVDAQACAIPPSNDPSETSWFTCFTRPATGGASYGVLCSKVSGGVGASGVFFERVCPKVTPTAYTTCESVPVSPDPYQVQGLSCGCQKPTGSACVCGCRRVGPNEPVSWVCLP